MKERNETRRNKCCVFDSNDGRTGRESQRNKCKRN